MTAGLDPETLRALVREALADLLPAAHGCRWSCAGSAGPGQLPPVPSAPASPPSAQPGSG